MCVLQLTCTIFPDTPRNSYPGTRRTQCEDGRGSECSGCCQTTQVPGGPGVSVPTEATPKEGGGPGPV
eukprot:178785-Rhodomonas_salina.1